jgi:hypothetical protein
METKYSIIKTKMGSTSMNRAWSKHKSKKSVLNELENLKFSWLKNGGQIDYFNKSKFTLVVSESDESAEYKFQISEN